MYNPPPVTTFRETSSSSSSLYELMSPAAQEQNTNGDQGGETRGARLSTEAILPVTGFEPFQLVSPAAQEQNANGDQGGETRGARQSTEALPPPPPPVTGLGFCRLNNFSTEN